MQITNNMADRDIIVVVHDHEDRIIKQKRVVSGELTELTLPPDGGFIVS